MGNYVSERSDGLDVRQLKNHLESVFLKMQMGIDLHLLVADNGYMDYNVIKYAYE